MQNAAGDGVAQAPHDQNAAYRAVVSDLVSLVEHVQNSLRLIEQTIARETSPETSPGSPESSTNVIVLDDVSPRYMKAAAALQACDVNLGIALRSLLDPGDSDPVPQACRRFRSSGRKADTAPSRWSVRCSANFPPDFLARLTACCDRCPASGMPRPRQRTRMPPRRWRSSN